MRRELLQGAGKDGRLSRREVIKRGALIGGAVWAAPVVQSFTTPAFAGTPAPCTRTYAVKFEFPDGSPFQPNASVPCHELVGDTVFCLESTGDAIPGGCAQGVSAISGAEEKDPWTVILPAGCSFVTGASKCASDLCNDDVVDNGDGSVTFFKCTGPTGKTHGISHTELIFCCP